MVYRRRHPVKLSRTSPNAPKIAAYDMTTAALFTAVLAASAWISIPLGSVPVTLQVFAVLLAGLILRPVPAALAVGAYVLLGAAGVPVFANATGGMGVLLGPTGGYIIGFAVAAPVVSLIADALARVWPRVAGDALACATGVAVIYGIGWGQLALVTGMGVTAALLAGVAPFIVIDAAKGAVAVGLAASVRRAGIVRSGVRV
jgi:biotin transport system substrate-specific component